jgi:hypothetical protein
MPHVDEADGIGAGTRNKTRGRSRVGRFDDDGLARESGQIMQGQASAIIARFEQEAITSLQPIQVGTVIIRARPVIRCTDRTRHQAEQPCASGPKHQPAVSD